MKVGARFWPLRTILFISEVGRRQRSADFAFSSAVSMELAAAPSMAWDSIRFPAQSNTEDRKSTRLNSSHQIISYAVFCLKKKKKSTEGRVRGSDSRISAYSQKYSI